MSGALVAVGAAAVGVQHALAGVSELVHEVIELGDEIGDTAERLGVSTRALQEWRYVAERSGLSTEALDRSIGILNRNTAAAARGSGGAAGAFRALGIALRDANGELRPTEAVLADTLQALSRIENPTERAGLAMQLFGRQGAGMAVIAGRGAEAVEALIERQRELGGGLSDDLVEGAGAADDAMIDFRLAMTSLKGVLAANVLPAVTAVVSGVASLVGRFVEILRTSSILETALVGLGAILGVLALATLPVSLPMLVLVAALGLLFLAIEDVVTAFRGGESVFGHFVEELAEAMGVTLSFEGILESFGVAWDEAIARAREGVASLLEGLVRLQRATGLGASSGLVRAAAGARADASQARSRATRSSAELAANERGRGIADAERDAIINAPPPPVVERRRRGRRARATPELHMPTTIQIHGAQDPAAVGREVDRHLRRRLREAAAAQPVAPEEDEA